MPFVKAPGLPGKLYVPETRDNCQKKHACKDCFSCGHCPDDRCNVCRDKKEVTSLPVK